MPQKRHLRMKWSGRHRKKRVPTCRMPSLPALHSPTKRSDVPRSASHREPRSNWARVRWLRNAWHLPSREPGPSSSSSLKLRVQRFDPRHPLPAFAAPNPGPQACIRVRTSEDAPIHLTWTCPLFCTTLAPRARSAHAGRCRTRPWGSCPSRGTPEEPCSSCLQWPPGRRRWPTNTGWLRSAASLAGRRSGRGACIAAPAHSMIAVCCVWPNPQSDVRMCADCLRADPARGPCRWALL
jgi:hypothetical protein